MTGKALNVRQKTDRQTDRQRSREFIRLFVSEMGKIFFGRSTDVSQF